VYSQHLNDLLLIFNLFLKFVLYVLHEVLFPRARVVTYDARQGQSSHDKEVLVDLIKQVFQVGVDTGLRVDSVLFVSQEVVELHDTYGDGLQLLRHENGILEVSVFDYLMGHGH
jgi:hypothetical protein